VLDEHLGAENSTSCRWPLAGCRPRSGISSANRQWPSSPATSCRCCSACSCLNAIRR
jgi:hypothetical protein